MCCLNPLCSIYSASSSQMCWAQANVLVQANVQAQSNVRSSSQCAELKPMCGAQANVRSSSQCAELKPMCGAQANVLVQANVLTQSIVLRPWDKKKMGQIDKLTLICGRWSALSLSISNNPDDMGNWWLKKWLPWSGSCHACRGLSSNSAEMPLTKLQEKYGSWKGVNFRSFRESGIAKGRHLPSVPMHRGKKSCRKKGRMRMSTSKDAIKEE